MQCTTCNGTGYRAGARECFVPRPGKVFAQNDYPQLELYTLAQCCKTWVGESKLAEALNGGLDPHLQLAAIIVGMSYEDAKIALKDSSHPRHNEVKEARGAAKVANFGFPGGLGIKSFVSYAKKAYGVVVTEAQAKQLKEFWCAAWPEMPLYFARVDGQGNAENGKGTVETLHTKRYRGQATYCARCNNGFQALGADAAKRAAWLICKAQYVGDAFATAAQMRAAADRAGLLVAGNSPLLNSRTVAFIHDEFIIEVDDGPTAHDAAYELARLMAAGANEYLPDVPIPMSKMEPLLMRRWSKKAEPVKGADGRLVPWV